MKTGPLPDTDTVELLKRAMRAFRGGFAVVSHSEKLIEEAVKLALSELFLDRIYGYLISFNGDLRGLLLFSFLTKSIFNSFYIYVGFYAYRYH